MSIKKTLPENNCFYFCTITCFQWLNLFKITSLYDFIYNWFDVLNKKYGIINNAYVIMPNHLHLVLYVPVISKSINSIISDSKRFLAYKIVDRLTTLNNKEILSILESGVSKKDKQRGKLHQVFEVSSDLKILSTEKFVGQKINYIHMNPVRKGLISLDKFMKYEYSSAGFYELDSDYKGYPVIHYKEVLAD